MLWRRIYNRYGPERELRLYLFRLYLVRLPWFGLYLHIFFNPDPERDVHNHPWEWCVTKVLFGGYVEKSVQGDGRYIYERRGLFDWPKYFKGAVYHTIARLVKTPTVTLFAHGREVRKWTFLDKGQPVDWDVYLVDKGINTPEEIEEARRRYGE